MSDPSTSALSACNLSASDLRSGCISETEEANSEAHQLMRAAIAEVNKRARFVASPNPWVGAAVKCASGRVYFGATEEPGKRHAEIVAMQRAVEAGENLHGAWLLSTLEPCNHQGRTPACTDAIIAAGIKRVTIALKDPDPLVSGAGIAALNDAGVKVSVGIAQKDAFNQLEPYLHHRKTNTPFVVLKLAASLDGFIAAPDGSSQWITGPQARADSHKLRAMSDAILIGAGTARADNPSLTVRDFSVPALEQSRLDPRPYVLGTIPENSKLKNPTSLKGELSAILQDLGENGITQLMVEGGARVAADFHNQGLVDRYVIYLAPALFGGQNAMSMFAGRGVEKMQDLWRGEIISVQQLGDDLRIELRAKTNTLT